ncbi:MAG: hypothetical protein K8F25_01665, partial [Fimbriimonadaceae bacterium]|nr:hypothetical protein [Alphaproteobacteria bacterium]
MSEDAPLSDVVSVSAKLSKSGVSVHAKSRLLAAADRLLGNLVDMPSPWIEHKAAVKRAKTQGEIESIRAAGAILAKQVGSDKNLANL